MPASHLLNQSLLNSRYVGTNIQLMLLLDSANIADTAAAVEFFRREIKTLTARPTVSWAAADLTWNATAKESRLAIKTIAVTAGTTPVQFDGYCLIQNPHSYAHTRVTSIATDPEGSVLTASNSIVNGQGTFTTTGTLPSGITAGTVYTAQVDPFSPTSFELINGSTALTIGTTFTGTLTWHPLIGTILPPFTLRTANAQGDRTMTIAPGQTQNIQIDFGMGIK